MPAVPAEAVMPTWLRLVMRADRAGSAWYVGTGFLFAPILVMLSPWPLLATVAWWLIALTGLYLGLLGIAMAVGLAQVLRSGAEIPTEFWWQLIGQRGPGARAGVSRAAPSRGASVRRLVSGAGGAHR
ncbi:hypothetical protein BHQ15_00590 [Mycolicibacillus koreensis]|nr:hypothetical protein BHQ15_00590 [Mycolicibacillus koreensis]